MEYNSKSASFHPLTFNTKRTQNKERPETMAWRVRISMPACNCLSAHPPYNRNRKRVSPYAFLTFMVACMYCSSSLQYVVPNDAPHYRASVRVHVETIFFEEYDPSCTGELRVNGEVAWSGSATETDWDHSEEGEQYDFSMNAGDTLAFESEGKSCVLMIHTFDYEAAD